MFERLRQVFFYVPLLFVHAELTNLAHAGCWDVTTVQKGSYFGYNYGQTSTVLDSQGRLHVFYVGDGLYHAASTDSGGWSLEEIVGVGGIADISGVTEELDGNIPAPTKAVSATIDSNGKFHVSYYDNATNSLYYASNKTGAWLVELVDTTTSSGSPNAFTLDADGYAHIAYYASTGSKVMYATNASGSWVPETVVTDDNVGSYIDLAVTSAGTVHILYYNYTDTSLNSVSGRSGAWSAPVTVDNAASQGQYISAAIGSDDKIHVGYFDNSSDNLKHAFFDGTTWTNQTIDSTNSVGWYTSIALDSSGNPKIAHYDDTNEDLRVSSLEGGIWTSTTVVSSSSSENVGWDPNIVISPSGDIAVIHKKYLDDNGIIYHPQLRIYGTGAFASLPQEIDVSHFYGHNVNLILGEEAERLGGTARSGMFISSTSIGQTYDLFLSTLTGFTELSPYDVETTWGTAVLDQLEPFDDPRTSLAISPDGTLSAAYLGGEGLSFQSETSPGVWGGRENIGATIEAALGSTSGWFIDLDTAADSQGNIHMALSYYSNTSQTYGLYYMSSLSPLTEPQSIYDNPTYNEFTETPQLLLDSDGNPFVIFENTTDDLMFAQRNGDTWTVSTIVESTNIAYPAAVFHKNAAGQDILHLTYYEMDENEIWYATWDGITWTKELILDGGGRGYANDQGPMLAIAIDGRAGGDGVPHITFYDSTSQALKHAWLENGVWQTDTVDDSGQVGTSSSFKIDSAGKMHVAYFAISHFDLRYAIDVACPGEATEECQQDSDCSDGNVCNGTEFCSQDTAGAGKTCESGTPLSCADDGNECTTESCDAALGCQSTAIASATDNACGACNDAILNTNEECDGSAPEGYVCDETCHLEVEEPECIPEQEICDGVDNDCDDMIDEEGCEEEKPVDMEEPASEAETAGEEGSEIPPPDDQGTTQCVEKNGQVISLDEYDIPIEILWGIREGTVTTFEGMEVVYDWQEGEVVAIGVCDTDSVPASLVFKGSSGIGGCSLNRD